MSAGLLHHDVTVIQTQGIESAAKRSNYSENRNLIPWYSQGGDPRGHQGDFRAASQFVPALHTK